jgi:predicted Zn-dependent protease
VSVRGDELLALAKRALAAAGEAEAEVVLSNAHRGFARFAMGELGQHMDLVEPQVLVRVAGGAGRSQVAEASASRLEEASIVRALHDAATAASRVPVTEGFSGFAGAGEPTGARPTRFAEATAAMGAEGRADLVAKVLGAVDRAGLVGAGALETKRTSMAVATTRGREVSYDSTAAHFRVWALETPGAGGAAGYGGATHRDVDALDLTGETERAIAVCQQSKTVGSLDEGTYDVVLEPAAVAELVEWLASIAFTATAVEQGTSALRGRFGERITGEAVTMVESPLGDDVFGLAMPFDREGVWRRSVPLIERGVARGVLYDRATAARAGVASTGSALLTGGGEATVGASAIHMEGGDATSVEELIAGVDRGLYVCRLHYVNGLMDPRRAVMTGLTRDGCFLIENGKVVRAVGNMRFTDSFLEGLGRADGMTRERRAVATAWSDAGAHVVPAIRMRGFRFNGRSQGAA